MYRVLMTLAVMLASVSGPVGEAFAASETGVDIVALAAELDAGATISPSVLQALVGIDVSLLSPDELTALLALLERLAAQGYDVEAQLALVQEQAAFLSTTAQDLPISASPTH